MDDNYIHFSIDGRDLKINKETPEDIFMWKTHGPGRQGKLKKPYWFQPNIVTNENGYKLIYVAKKRYRLHRINYYAHNQTWNIHDSSMDNFIDHKDINITNNNIENLRVVTNQQNHFNRNCKGYSWDKSRQKWQSRIKINGKVKFLGRFNTEDEAHQAYLEAKKIFHIIE